MAPKSGWHARPLSTPCKEGLRRNTLGGCREPWAALVFCSFLPAVLQRKSVAGQEDKARAGVPGKAPMTKGRRLWRVLQKGYLHAKQKVRSPQSLGEGWGS